MRVCVFECKGCMKVVRLVQEVEYLRQIMETMKRMVTGLVLEEKGGQTGGRVARREEEKEKGEGVLTPDRSDDTSAEDRDAVIEKLMESMGHKGTHREGGWK